MANEDMPRLGFERPSHWSNDRQFFFKYMIRPTGKIVLENHTLRWSWPGTLNDPYDVEFDLRIEIDRLAVKTAALKKLWDAFYGTEVAQVGNLLGLAVDAVRSRFPQLEREEFDREFGEAIDEGFAGMERILPSLKQKVRSLMANSKVLCLSEVPDSTLMWAHYAEQHKGLVLRFRSVPELDSAWGAAQPIQYLTEIPRLFDNEFLADMLAGRVSMDAKSIMHKLLYAKAAEWAYEREWRLSSGLGRNPEAPFEDNPFDPIELDAIIFGCRMPDEDRASFANMMRRLYPHAEILAAVKSERQFQLEILPYKA